MKIAAIIDKYQPTRALKTFTLVSMFKTIIFSSKPRMTGRLLPYLAQHYDAASTLIAHLGGISPAQFDFKAGALAADEAVEKVPHYKISANFAWKAFPMNQANDAGSELSNEAVLSAIENATEIVFAGDPHATDVDAFVTALKLLRPTDKADHVAYVVADSGPAAIEAALDNPVRLSGLAHLAQYGEVKRYFDWNWNRTALKLLPRVLAAAGVEPDATVSKYGLQILYYVRDARRVSIGALISKMQNWTGSGVFAESEMGSPMSRGTIVAQLQSAGLLTMERGIRLTDAAQEFLALLPGQCEDVDLPARIHQWCLSGLSASKSAIDEYLEVFFAGCGEGLAPVATDEAFPSNLDPETLELFRRIHASDGWTAAAAHKAFGHLGKTAKCENCQAELESVRQQLQVMTARYDSLVSRVGDTEFD